MVYRRRGAQHATEASIWLGDEPMFCRCCFVLGDGATSAKDHREGAAVKAPASYFVPLVPILRFGIRSDPELWNQSFRLCKALEIRMLSHGWIASGRKRSNQIANFLDGANLIEREEDIRRYARDFYAILFS
ncbi:hypothetical protein Taro_023538, partial [Colocasia esculenta]|nr:hypothetical protein [Colocasia esculenta]